MTAFFVILALVLAVLAGGYTLWARHVRAEIAEGAGIAWERINRTEPDFLEGLTRADFDRAYLRAHFPRFPKYFLATLAAFVVALPIVLGGLSALLWGAEKVGVVAEPVEIAKYVPLGEGRTDVGRAQREEMALYLARDFGGFYYFFGLVAAWILMLAVTMRVYHMRRPGRLREELIRARDAAETDHKETA